ncbi:hypothetical protein ACPW7J_14635 (plasmid) [Ihubacter sp. rT4E-8]|uniref:hypothetical protein n=1 Tax=Ihubacter sp. rT4E-8 TaxID=3242369 RepID=UPI003CF03A7A
MALFKALPADKQFQAMIETELPETQLQPELMQELRSVMENDLQQTERDWGEEFY